MDLQNMATTEEIGAQILEYILTQYSLGTKQQLTQFHDLDTFEPTDADSLTENDKKNAIASLMFLTEKKMDLPKQEHMLMVENSMNQLMNLMQCHPQLCSSPYS